MGLSNDEAADVESIIVGAAENMRLLSPWERTFINDITARFDEEGAAMYLSVKQWQALRRIEDKL